MAFVQTWDSAAPLGSMAANLLDDRIRDLKESIEERMQVEHRWAGDSLDGRHKLAGSAPASPASGDQYFDTATGILYIHNGTAWIPITVTENYIKVSDTKVKGTAADAANTSALTAVTLNTEDTDTHSLCTLASNQITLTLGTYRCHILVPAIGTNQFKTRLYNTTGAATLVVGSSVWTVATAGVMSHSLIVGRFTVAAAQVLEVQAQGSHANSKIGKAANLTEVEMYTIAEFWKVD